MIYSSFCKNAFVGLELKWWLIGCVTEPQTVFLCDPPSDVGDVPSFIQDCQAAVGQFGDHFHDCVASKILRTTNEFYKIACNKPGCVAVAVIVSVGCYGDNAVMGDAYGARGDVQFCHVGESA